MDTCAGTTHRHKEHYCRELGKIENPVLEPLFFKMGYVLSITMRAIFEAPLEYQTFYIHFEFSFLLSLGIDYKTLGRFLNGLDKKETAELSDKRHRCTPRMVYSIRLILSNQCSRAGRERLLGLAVENILVAALEEVAGEELGKNELPKRRY